MLWAVVLAVLAGLGLVWAERRRRLVAAVDAIPGPPAVPLLGNTHILKTDRLAFAEQMEEMCFRYQRSGGVFRFWVGPKPVVVLTSAVAMEPLLRSTALITKTDIGYTFLKELFGDGLLVSSGNKWHSRRKMLTPAFHFGILQDFISVQRNHAQILTTELEKNMGEIFDIFPYLNKCALDVICETAMGVSVNAQLARESAYVRAIDDLEAALVKRQRMPWLWAAWSWRLLGDGAAWERDRRRITGFTRKVIRERKAQLAAEGPRAQGRPAFLDLLLQMQASSGLTDADVAEEVNTFMSAGHSTTAVALAWTLFLIGNHPDTQDKLAEELDAIFGDDDRPASVEDLKEMRYLDLVLKESHRLYPPVPIFARHVSQNFVAGGYTIPKGATALIPLAIVQRDPDEFGANAASFEPERFLPCRSGGRHPLAAAPFSAGPRNCIGQRFAQMEEKVVLSGLLRRLRFASADAVAAVRPVPDVVLRPPAQLRMTVSRRR